MHTDRPTLRAWPAAGDDTDRDARAGNGTGRGPGCGIVMLLASVDGWIGGAQQQASLLANELAGRGLHVIVVNQCPGPLRLRRARLQGGVETIALPVVKWSPRWSFLSSFLVWAIVNRHRFQLIHAHSPSAGITAALVGRLLGKPIVVKVPSMEVVRALASRRPIARWLLNRLAGAVVAVSTEMLQALSAAGVGRERLTLIPNGVGVAPTNAGGRSVTTRRWRDERGPVILYVGRLAEVKGVRQMLRAWSALSLRHEATLLIVGDGPLRSELQRDVVERGLNASVRFAGSQTDVAPFYRMADVFVLPSQSEGLSNALLEAMAAGLPVIASDVGGNRDVIEDGVSGFLVDWQDTAQLDRLMTTLVDDADLRDRVGEAARRRAASFSIATVADRYCDLYRTLVMPPMNHGV